MDYIKFKTGKEFEEELLANLNYYQAKAAQIIKIFEKEHFCKLEESLKAYFLDLETISSYFLETLGDSDEYCYVVGYPLYTSFVYDNKKEGKMELADLYSLHPRAKMYNARDTAFLPYDNREEFICLANNGSGVNIVYKFKGLDKGKVYFISNFFPEGIDLEVENASENSIFKLNLMAASFDVFYKGLKI